ncbi:hypothetical protein [Butyrivibrio sp. AE2032]|uniref:hypothetical protein n=1 Tax=Butyrivibrio sp. AE2032 TaxID=1458463 RepID=UPI000557A90D|nr:hypothetical protein [Butyrivibrio sp. AE2032]
MAVNTKIYTFEKNDERAGYVLTVEKNGVRYETVYVEMRAPNKNVLKRMVEAAKGPARTLTQFAKDCSDISKCSQNTKKINTPAFARVLAGNDVVRPLKEEIIQALLNNAADRKIVNPDDLLRANGYELRSVAEREKNASMSLESTREFIALKSRADADIRRRLSAIGNTTWISVPDFSSAKDPDRPHNDRFFFSDRFGVIEPYDLNTVFVDTGTNLPVYWGFCIDSTAPSVRADKAGAVKKFREILLEDIIHPEEMNDLKISFVYQNRNLYNAAVSELSDIKVSNYISVVLIQKGEIAAEFTLGRRDGKKQICLLGEACEHFEGEGPEEAIKIMNYGHIERMDVPLFGY